MRTLTCTPREPDVFGQPVRPSVAQRRVHHVRHLADLRPRHARHRIEIHPQLVRVIQILGADRMRVQLEAGQVREPGERRGVAWHHFLRASSRWKAQGHHLDPRTDARPAPASGRRIRRRSRRDSAPARWAGRRRLAARPRPPPGSSARGRASCIPAPETAPCPDSRSRSPGPRPGRPRRRSCVVHPSLAKDTRFEAGTAC